jgi:hypothetical protein
MTMPPVTSSTSRPMSIMRFSAEKRSAQLARGSAGAMRGRHHTSSAITSM